LDLNSETYQIYAKKTHKNPWTLLPSVSTESSSKQTLACVSLDKVMKTVGQQNFRRLNPQAFSLFQQYGLQIHFDHFLKKHVDITASRVSPESESQFQNAKFSIPFIQQNF
jgi:hypothetical protein